MTNREPRPARLVGMMTVRNEADILEQTLSHNAILLDAILVVDAGSSDASLEIIERVHQRHPHVTLAGTFPSMLPEQIRCHLWRCFRGCLTPDDWWVIVDADEFLEQGVRDKVYQARSEGADHLFSWHVNFYYKEFERQNWLDGRETMSDRERPVHDRRRWYCMHNSMIRAFRNLPWTRWDTESYVPASLSQPARGALVFRHYQYRDLPQVEARIKTRKDVTAPLSFFAENPHWKKNGVDDAISPDDDPNLTFWDLEAPFQVHPKMPPIPRQSWLKSFLKYARARVRAVSAPQGELQLFRPEDASLLQYRSPK